MRINDHNAVDMKKLVENSKINPMQNFLFQRIEAENDKNIEKINQVSKVCLNPSGSSKLYYYNKIKNLITQLQIIEEIRTAKISELISTMVY
jgi:hypothetical protein